MFDPLLHEIDITKYQPATVNDYLEFIEIGKTENVNFNRVRIDLLQLFSMRFINDTDEVGIARWEKMLKIKRRASDDLELRRMRVLAKINNKLPYTWRTLHQLMTSFYGEGNYRLDLDPQEYMIEILIPSSTKTYNELVDILEPMVPLNILFIVAEGLENEILKIITGTYAWHMNYKICGRFRPVSKPGVLANELLALIEGIYGFNYKSRITSRFKVTEKFGVVAGQDFYIQDGLYEIKQNTRICGRFRAGGARI